mgnify:CR=1 FL=1|jgi:hypothetical protein
MSPREVVWNVNNSDWAAYSLEEPVAPLEEQFAESAWLESMIGGNLRGLSFPLDVRPKR